MFEALSLYQLQMYWWFLVSLLAALLVFLMFVQGGQSLLYCVGKTPDQRSLIVNALGRKWELTFTTLVTFGGAFFASFPMFYSTSFGGAYWVWMAILFAFVLQAVSFEFRVKAGNILGPRVYEFFLQFNGFAASILIGTAVATFFTGSSFVVDRTNLYNLSGIGNTTISIWTGPAHGLEAVLNPINLALGLAVFFLVRVLGLQYFVNSIADENIVSRSRKLLIYNAVPFLVFFLAFVGSILLKDGFAVEPTTGTIVLKSHKYFLNLLQMPLVALLFSVGVVLVLYGIIRSWIKVYKPAFYITSLGVVLAVLSLFLLAGYNDTSYYPSVGYGLEKGSVLYNQSLQSSLTIRNSSSSHFTLTAMSYVSLFVPFVLAYIIIVWRSMNKKQLNLHELNSEMHKY